MNKLIRYFVVLLLLEVVILVAQAQNSDKPNHLFSLDANLGLGGPFNDIALTSSGEIRLNLDGQFISGQVLWTRGVSHIEGEPQEWLLSFSMLYGVTYSFHLKRQLFPLFPLSLLFDHEADYTIAGAAGAGVTRSVIRGRFLNQHQGVEGLVIVYAYDPEISYGFPIEVEVTQAVSPSLGYVHRLYCNLNNRRIVYGLLWGLQVYF
jgi:hypothetical protein